MSKNSSEVFEIDVHPFIHTIDTVNRRKLNVDVANRGYT
jgi:hypothetical protein